MDDEDKKGENVSGLFPDQEIKSVEASLDFSLYAECPYCQYNNDLAGYPHDEEGCFSIPLFNNKWDEIKGHEVTCDCCEQMFTISKVEY